MIVLSLFDGMSCGQLALQKAGIKVDKYFASEIDKHAIKVTMANFPDTIQLGDVTKVFAKDLPQIDMIIGGSPCQGFSFAGKGLNFEDPRSKLFFEFVRLIQECKPKYFLLENVKMKKEHEIVITKYLGVEPIEINSALVSAQNRKRLYWTNINQKSYGLFGDLISDIPQPQDKGILLKDVLEKEVPNKYYLSDRILNGFLKHNEIHKERGNGFEFKPRDENNKSSCITARYHKMGVDDTFIIASRGRNTENSQNTEQNLEPCFDGKTNTITSVQKGNYVVFGSCFEQDNRAYFEEGKSGTLDTKPMRQKVLLGESKIRRLTPLECERLQTVPDNYTNHVSDTQRYRMLGNGWTISVISHIFSYLPK